jgi:hypothetical protein
MTLPSPSAHGLADDATIAVPVPAEGLRLFRLIEGEQPTVRDFEERLTRAQAERDAVPELFRLCVSHWLEHDRAAAQSRRRRFYVARIELPGGGLTRVALTEQHGRGHVDVWAHPQTLIDAVAEVVPGRRLPLN